MTMNVGSSQSTAAAKAALRGRREFLFLYDIKMGNPNGDPDENRPRVLPDGTHYVTDVRLKRFIRDFFKMRGSDILVDSVEGRTTNLTGRVADHLEKIKQPKAEGEDLVNILLDSFIDARLFGSSFAFKEQKDWKPQPQPKTLTGATQINHGEVLHRAQEVDIHGTSVFASDEGKTQGTFTTYFGLRYALIGFCGVANEHSAKLSRMTDGDYEGLLVAMWKGVRSAGNTRTKVGQVPRLLVSVEYKTGEEFQFGNLMDYVKLHTANGKKEEEWSSAADYRLDLSLLTNRLGEHTNKIERIRYCVSPDVKFADHAGISGGWQLHAIDADTQK
jgi:CRISPR-associated protein Csh2